MAASLPATSARPSSRAQSAACWTAIPSASASADATTRATCPIGSRAGSATARWPGPSSSAPPATRATASSTAASSAAANGRPAASLDLDAAIAADRQRHPRGPTSYRPTDHKLRYLDAATPLCPHTRYRRRPECADGAADRLVRRKLVLSDTARHPADPDDPGTAARGVAAGCLLHSRLGGGRAPRLRDRLFPVRYDRAANPRILPCDGSLRRAEGRFRPVGHLDHHPQGDDPDPLQADHNRERRRAFRPLGLYRRLDHLAQPAVLSRRRAAVVVRRCRPPLHRKTPD